MFALTLIYGALAASQVAALPHRPSFSLDLFSRQSVPSIPASDIPSQCQSACSAMLNIGTTCPTSSLDCLCGDSTGNAFVSCGNCVVKLPGVTSDLKASEQQSLDALTATCKDGGHPFSNPLKLDSSSSGAMTISPSGALAMFGIVAGLLAVGI